MFWGDKLCFMTSLYKAKKITFPGPKVVWSATTQALTLDPYDDHLGSIDDNTPRTSTLTKEPRKAPHGTAEEEAVLAVRTGVCTNLNLGKVLVVQFQDVFAISSISMPEAPRCQCPRSQMPVVVEFQ